MANYNQWKAKHPEYKPLYYVCGEELTLVLEVQDAVVNQYAKGTYDFVFTSASRGFADIESAVLESSSRLKVVVARNIDQLTDLQKDEVENWAWQIVQGKLTNICLIVVTAEVNPDTALPLFRPFVEKGRFVECKSMSPDNMRKYAMDEYRCTEAAANLLMELVSFNFMRFNNELEKLNCLDLHTVDEHAVNSVVVFSADDLFVQYLLNRNPQALKVVSAVPVSAITPVLNALTKKLAFLHNVIINDTPGIGAHKLAAILGVQPWQLLEHFAIKRYWTAPLILEKLRLLTVMEKQYAAHSSNILPLLATWW